jgi:hypothetical protein
MSKIDSFIEWSNNRDIEYKQRIEETLNDLCQEELEMAESIIDMTLDDQDDGSAFKFRIFLGKWEGINRWMKAVYTLKDEWVTVHHEGISFEEAFKRCVKNLGSCFLRIEGNHIPKNRLDILQRRIKSAFPDWKFIIDSSDKNKDGWDIEFALTIYKM